MSPERWDRIKQLFVSAIEREGSARKAFLHEACRDDAELRTQVEALIAAHDSDPTFLEQPVSCTPEELDGALGCDPQFHDLLEPSTETSPDATSRLPKRIGQYSTRRVIASGGMGTVYEATQERPRRAVALKLMKQGISSRSVLRRFEYESQILARLRHPGIAQVYEAGTHEDDTGTTPFFAMEYIPNALPITRYAKEKKLGTRQRLELFRQVCAAVHHGHQKGIIHRDLKPSNILVDSHGQVKVIDFGVARCTDSDLAVTTLQTDVGQILGTLQFMSPEQCKADPHDIDTRSDVYALGVVLYELLIERLPYDVTGMPIHEATRVILEEQPTKLSTINKTLRGDVETITLKALEKDRDRRYQSASALMADLERYLKNQPISARPASASYQFRKLVVRHKMPFAFLAVLFLVVSAAAVWMSVMYARAEDLRVEAVAARDESDQVVTFLTEMLGAADPSQGRKDIMVREVLDQAATRLAEFADKPLIEARLRQAIGWTYRGLGLLPAAETYLKDAEAIYARELGPEHPKTLRAAHARALLMRDMGKYEQGEALLRQTLEAQRRVLGEGHPDTLTSMNSMASALFWRFRFAEGEAMCRHALEIRRRVLGEEHPDTLKSMQTLAAGLSESARPAEAEPIIRRTLEIQRRVLGKEHPDTLRSMTRLSYSLRKQGRMSEAETLDKQLFDVQRRVLGEEHPDTLHTMNQLTYWLRRHNRYDEAETMCLKMLEIQRRTLGEDHPSTLWSKNHLATILHEQGRNAEAETLFRETLDEMRRALAEWDPARAGPMVGLARTLEALGRYAEAETLLREALEIRRRAWGEEHPEALTAMALLANHLNAQGRPAEAETLYREMLEIQRRKSGDEDPKTLWCKNKLASILRQQGRNTEAESLYREVMATRRRKFGEEDPKTLRSKRNLASILRRQGRNAEAETLYREVLETRRRVLGEEHRDTLASLNDLARFLFQPHRMAEAESHFRELAEIRRRTLGAGAPETLDALWMHAMCAVNLNNNNEALRRFRQYVDIVREQRPDDEFRIAAGERRLGWAHTQLGSYEEAERLLLGSYEYFKEAQAEPIVGRDDLLLMTLDHLAELYEKWDKPEKARKYAAAGLERRRQRSQHPKASALDHNDYAWALLTCEPEELRDPVAALPVAQRAVALSEGKNAAILDTLALAYFLTGDAAKAVAMQEKAVALLPAGDSSDRAELEANLAEYRETLAEEASPRTPADRDRERPDDEHR